eukprot:CAMPEP_0184714118 /NCGR_PEP_ID=MMETSP0314-20130426/4335_1 /TAXON_ID=38298 /ORGANISM="Rhodella maculata, Strain CCMP 736" /LENGTH=99 /DNA_ID=CAMNT_0027176943 /DNA_START=16 /DNA_END=315 /DNA_ORIENTATION=-
MDAMKKAQDFSKDAKKLQDELKETILEVKSDDGMVTVNITGQQNPISVEITDELLAMGTAAVNKSVTEAVKAAHAQSLANMTNKLGSLTSAFGLPVPPQ